MGSIPNNTPPRTRKSVITGILTPTPPQRVPTAAVSPKGGAGKAEAHAGVLPRATIRGKSPSVPPGA